MSKTTKAKKHNSSILQELFDEISPLEMEKARTKMKLAANIEDLMKSENLSKLQFANKVGKNPSEITKWLSGTQNFTVDVLTEISMALGVDLRDLFGKQQNQVIYQREIVVNSVAEPTENMLTPYSRSGEGLIGTCSCEIQVTGSKKHSHLNKA
ncbi:MAG: helix-turn-helix transcriptional regulator [Bacteroidales bacterium]|nr:helix-turn-helix transcriptional regulator [Bacteroidales bacterium]